MQEKWYKQEEKAKWTIYEDQGGTARIKKTWREGT
jgi:hypothetical protein